MVYAETPIGDILAENTPYTRIGPGVRFSASFQKTHLVGRLGSGVGVSESFQIFSRGGGGNLRSNISRDSCGVHPLYLNFSCRESDSQ